MTFSQRFLLLLALAAAIWAAILILRVYFRRAEVPARFDPADAGLPRGGVVLIEFVSPFCYECKVAMPVLKAASVVHRAPLAVIDAKIRPDLATKYSIRHTPTILVVDRKGTVKAGWLGTPPAAELEQALKSASNGR